MNTNLTTNSDNDNNIENYNLEIIEYPYSSNIDDQENNNYDIEYTEPSIPLESKIMKRNLINDYDDFDDIMPPKLFSEKNKESNVIKDNRIESNEKKEDNKLIENANNNNLNVNIKSNNDSKENIINSSKNELLDSKNDYINFSKPNEINKYLEETYKEKEKMNINDEINKKQEIKIEYPGPDKNDFFINRNDNTLKKIGHTEIIPNEKIDKKEINKKIEKKIFMKKMKKIQMQNSYKKNIFFQNNRKSIIETKNNINISQNNLDMKGRKIKKAYDDDKKLLKKKKKKVTFRSLLNFENKYNLSFKHTMDKEHTSFFKDQNQRPKLNNLDLKNILNNNINDKSKHIKTSMTTKKFKGISHISKIANLNNSISSQNYQNPFKNIYKRKKVIIYSKNLK